MNFHMKPHPLMAHWAPGFFLSAAVLLRHYAWSYHRLMDYMPPSQTKSFLIGMVILVVSWIAGQALDAMRDILEHLVDLAHPLDWDFFFWAEPVEVEKFEEHYFSYYVFSFNTAIAMAGLLLVWLGREGFPFKVIAGITFLLVFFTIDTCLLRMEIQRVLSAWNKQPHRGNVRERR